MGVRGRRSAADLAISVDGKPERLKPPTHLGPDERRRFDELVESCDSTHFRRSDLPLLCRYVEADALGERAAAELRVSGPVINGRASPWLTAQEKAVRALVALSMRLRLSPQSRIDPKAASLRSDTAKHRPWERKLWE
jgi:phage terminase small subunit